MIAEPAGEAGLGWLGEQKGARTEQGTAGTWFDADTHILYDCAYPGAREWEIRLRLENGAGNGPHILIGRQFFKFLTGGQKHPVASIQRFLTTSKASALWPFPAGEVVDLSVIRRSGRLTITGSHGLAFAETDPDPDMPLCDLELFFAAGTHVLEFSIDAPPVCKAPQCLPPLRPMLRSVSIDFNDDLISGPWNESSIGQQMEFYKKAGMRRVYFLPTAPVGDGYWEVSASEFPRHKHNLLETHAAIGDFLSAFAAAAKSFDLEFFAVYKPFDQGFEKGAVPFGTRWAEEIGAPRSLGGLVARTTDWIRANPEKRLRRHPADLAAATHAGEIRRLILSSEVPCEAFPVSVWTSADNRHYQKIAVTVDRRSPHELVVEIPAGLPPRLAILREPGPAGRFGNRLRDLIRCEDARGCAVPVTFATASDVSRRRRPGAFPEVSFAFDVNFAGRPEVDSRGSFVWLDEGVPLAVSKGFEEYVIGGPCPAYDAVREAWLAELRRCFDCGCDGVDVRVANHNRTMDWERYGYNAPVLDRAGEDAGPNEVRSLLGEWYSLFMQAASDLAKACGKSLHAHLEHGFRGADLPCDMNIAFQWERWIEQGWVHEVTLMAHSARAGIMPRMLQKSRAHGIPANIRPYFNSMVRGAAAAERIADTIRDAHACKVDGMNIYENWPFFEVDSKQQIVCRHPELWQQFSQL